MDPVSHQEAAEFGEVANYVRCLVEVNATKTFITIYLVKEGMTHEQNCKFDGSVFQKWTENLRPMQCYCFSFSLYSKECKLNNVYLFYIQNNIN